MSFTPISGSDSRTGDLKVVLPASTSGRTGLPSSLSLEVGATLLARVVSQDAGEVTLALLGRLVACRSQLELPQGAIVNLLVREVGPERIVLSPQTLPSGSTVDHSAERELLKSLGLPDSPEAVFVAKRLLAEGHPLEQRLFQEVWQGLKRLGLIERSETSASGAASGFAPGSASDSAAGSTSSTASGTAQSGSSASAGSAESTGSGATVADSTGAEAANATGGPGTATTVSTANATTASTAANGAAASGQASMDSLTAALGGGKSDAATALSLLNGHSVEAVVDAVAFLAANGRPITPDSVRAVLAVRDADPGLGQLIQDLAKAVADLESSLAGRSYAGASLATGSQALGAPASPALAPGLAQNLRDLGNLLADIRFSPFVESGSLGALSTQLADVLGKLGLDHELQLGLLFGGPSAESATTATLAEQLIEGNTAQALVAQESLGEAPAEIFTSGREQSQAGRPETSQVPAGDTGGGAVADGGAAKAGVDSAKNPSASVGPDSGALQDSAAKSVPDTHGTLKGLLLAVREQLKELGFGTGNGAGTSPSAGANTAAGQAAATAGKAQLDEATALAKLAKTAAEALDNLTGQRLAGQAPERPGQTPVELLVQIPVQVGKETQTAELKFFVDRDGKKRNGLLKETVRVSCRLTTSNMGQVRLDLNLRGKLVDCHLTLANEEVLTYLHEHQAELEQAFKEAGLQSGTVSYARKQPDEPSESAARPLSHFSVRL